MTSPVLDEQVLGRLREDVGDPRAVTRFLGRYARMLDGRVDRLCAALLAQDLDAWHDAALSLKSSSAMAGAVALSELVSSLLDEVESRSPVLWWYCTDEWAPILHELRTLASETRCQMDEFLADSS